MTKVSSLSITNLKCGCFFSGRIFNPVCSEHKKPSDWDKVADNLTRDKETPFLSSKS